MNESYLTIEYKTIAHDNVVNLEKIGYKELIDTTTYKNVDIFRKCSFLIFFMLVSTIASVATISVGVGIGVFGVNRAIEAVTGANYVARTVFRENKPAYNTTEAAFTAHRGVWPWNFGQNLDE